MSSFENSHNLLYSSSKRKNIPDGLWNRCEVCGEITFSKELDRNFKICPKCGYHYPMSASERIRMLIASKSFIEYESRIHVCEGSLRSRKDVTSELVTAGEARLHEYKIVLCIISSNPTDGSNIQFKLNKKEYEKILSTFNKSLMKSLPLITFYADGTIVNLSSKYATPACAAHVAAGRPICEGINIERNNHKTKSSVLRGTKQSEERSKQNHKPKALVNEVNTTTKGEMYSSEWLSFIFLINLAATVEKLSQKRIPHLTVLTNPRVGGEFSTSFPLGDIVIAEPKPVNLRPTDNRKNNIITKNVPLHQLPPENSLIDRYVNRRDLKKNLTKILSFCVEE